MVTQRQELVQKWVKSQTYTSWRRNREHIFFIPKNVKTVTIPANKTSMLCLISYLVISNKGNNQSALINEAKYEIDIVDPDKTIDVQVNLVKQKGWFRETSGEFFKYFGERVYVDGYWLLLTMPNGSHIVQSHASCRSGKIRIDDKFQVIIK